MPGFTTHHIFGILTYKKLNSKYIKDIIANNISAYKLGLQGPDIFFYYLPNVIKNPEHSLGKIMHEVNTNTFFKNYFNEINHYQEHMLDAAYAYISGFLCHYCLDTICHPYIYARTNYNPLPVKNKDNGKNIYSAHHRSFETLIDSILLDRYTHKKHPQFLKENTIYLDQSTKKIITPLLATCINKTYSGYIKLKPGFISRSIRFLQIESKILSGLAHNRKHYVEQLENRFFKYNLLSSLIPDNVHTDTLDALNLSHNIWHSPWEVSISRNDSFLNLMENAYKKCTILLNLVDSLLHYRKDSQNRFEYTCTDLSQILNEIGNLSYHSGLLID
ncbi:zinc dependent phospholipase C [Mobilisporobacter senegalensis]|uniref:Zinc dependent phospholipase C n=1 Tax=Mobilisporobacter senegalensis TaxID=1329262 RepID=A0A3N1XVY1_9FIRM|nr:zinc dependent phospholipase C family protein [Mobilisporobacter senegalensis]ROR30361.1 zinc dependent phospholipase C [Mobilisporobacter senegalensis]